jgi:N-acetylglucosamine malate deacetylase 1
MMYETISETEYSPALHENSFMPNTFYDVTDYFEKKLEIMKHYQSEIMKEFYPRSLSSIEALARFRGSSIGRKYAEAFVLLKHIID